MLTTTDINVQQQLFPVSTFFLDKGGYLSKEAAVQIKQIERDLKAKDLSLEEITDISKDTWNNWLYRKRPPSGAALAFLTLFLMQPEMVLQTLLSRKPMLSREPNVADKVVQ